MSTNERDALLQRVVVGDLSPDDPEVRARCASDAAFARELQELLRVVHALEHEEREARAVLAAVSRESSSSASGSSVQAVPASQSPAAQIVRRPRRVWPWLAAAAAVAFMLVAVDPFGWRRIPDSVPDYVLGDNEVRCLEPVGEVADFSVFRWQSGSSAGFFDLYVLDENGNEIHPKLSLSNVSEWRPPRELHSSWPKHIRWRIKWSDTTNHLLDENEVEARRP